ncbi:MAG: hypothetical protein GY862_04245, partial [Gammaproteobacteria bacterium]|nr:hypothetical protein [Gammaproteobacteria bacterium]
MIKQHDVVQPKWIFVIGCYNSGTTLLENILRKHPSIAGLPDEGQFLTDALISPKSVGAPRLWAEKENLFRFSPDEKTEEAEQVKRDWIRLLDKPRAPFAVEKSPPNTARTLWLQKHFQEPYFIHIVRNGYAVAIDIHDKIQALTGMAPDLLHKASNQWVRSVEAVLEDALELTHFLEIRYEDLTADPAGTSVKIFNFLGLSPFSPEISTLHAPIRNQNPARLAEMTKQQEKIINACAGDLLNYYGYSSREPGLPARDETGTLPENRAGGNKRLQSVKQHSRAIIILGMHRSGTSALTRILNLSGVELGNRLLPGDVFNEKGFWELVPVTEENEKILHTLNFSWFDPAPLPEQWQTFETITPFHKRIADILRQHFKTSTLWGIKDPRLCRLLPLWMPALKETAGTPSFVIIARNPYEAAASLAKRDGLSRNTSLRLWLLHLLEAEQHTQGYPRVFVTYDELLKDWRSVVEKIAQTLELTWPNAIERVREQVNDFLSPDLKHHHAVLKTAEVNLELSSWCDTVYQAITQAAAGDVVRLDALSPIRGALAEQTRFDHKRHPPGIKLFNVVVPLYPGSHPQACIKKLLERKTKIPYDVTVINGGGNIDYLENAAASGQLTLFNGRNPVVERSQNSLFTMLGGYLSRYPYHDMALLNPAISNVREYLQKFHAYAHSGNAGTIAIVSDCVTSEIVPDRKPRPGCFGNDEGIPETSEFRRFGNSLRSFPK